MEKLENKVKYYMHHADTCTTTEGIEMTGIK